jgi:hypothetical protein
MGNLYLFLLYQNWTAKVYLENSILAASFACNECALKNWDVFNPRHRELLFYVARARRGELEIIVPKSPRLYDSIESSMRGKMSAARKKRLRRSRCPSVLCGVLGRQNLFHPRACHHWEARPPRTAKECVWQAACAAKCAERCARGGHSHHTVMK